MGTTKAAVLGAVAACTLLAAGLGAYLLGQGSHGNPSVKRSAPTTASGPARARTLALAVCDEVQVVKVDDAAVAASFVRAESLAAEAARLDDRWSSLQRSLLQWDDDVGGSSIAALRPLSEDSFQRLNDDHSLTLFTAECEKAGKVYSHLGTSGLDVPVPLTTTSTTVPQIPGRPYLTTADLTVRSGPGTQFSQLGSVGSGTTVIVSCSAIGESIDGPYGPTNRWDHISFGTAQGFATDEYVDTKDDIKDPALIPPC